MHKITLFLIALIIPVMVLGKSKKSTNFFSINIRYDSHIDGANNWEYRRDDFINYFNLQKPDIVCMQEVQYNQLMDILDGMPRYDYIGVGRADGKTSGEYVAILYLKKRYQVLDSGTFWLSEKPNEMGSIGWDASLPRIVTWAKMYDSKTKSEFMVLNTHLDVAGKTARINSAKLITNWINVNSKGMVVVLAGDFNDSEKSEAYRIFIENSYLKDTFNPSIKDGIKYSFHDFGRVEKNRRVKLDYILVSKDVNVISTEIIEEKEHNGHYISDHNPLKVKLKF